MTVCIPFGREEVSVVIPDENLIEVISPNTVAFGDSEDGLIARGLARPIESRALAQIAAAKMSPDRHVRVCIICDDLTRSTPAHKIIPPLLRELNAAGIPDERIYAVMALGSHRYMTKEEMIRKVGKASFDRIRVYNSQFNRPEGLVNMGTTQSGIPVLLDKRVSEADIKIGIGSIVPHPVVGWSGGVKIIFPGVTGEETVTAFHLEYAKFQENLFGADTTPVRAEIEKWIELVGLDYIVNCVCLPDGKLYQVVSGHCVYAQRKGIEYAKEVYGVKIKRKADVVIASSYPADADLWQATKAVCGADHAARDGGEIILLTPCNEGIGPHGDFDLLIHEGQQNPQSLLERSLEGNSLDPLAASGAIHLGRVIGKNKKISIISSGLTDGQCARMNWQKYRSAQEAVDRAVARQAKISVMTHGGYLCPSD